MKLQSAKYHKMRDCYKIPQSFREIGLHAKKKDNFIDPRDGSGLHFSSLCLIPLLCAISLTFMTVQLQIPLLDSTDYCTQAVLIPIP